MPPSDGETAKTVYEEARTRRFFAARCTKTRTGTFGVGRWQRRRRDLMFIGEAPGATRTAWVSVGEAGKLLDKLLAEIGVEE